MDTFQLSPKITLNENELATRWGISPKTLQRWRCEGRGPKYFKLSKRVSYPIDEILAFEFESL
ncbi:MAG: helix-turn-helix transcriptional regulator, partial [Betaproteobacteria bacterium]